MDNFKVVNVIISNTEPSTSAKYWEQEFDNLNKYFDAGYQIEREIVTTIENNKTSIVFILKKNKPNQAD